MFRSVTKFFAIPGLRVAYAVSDEAIAEGLNRYLAPWPVSSLAADAVLAALQDNSYADQSRRANDQGRLWLRQHLNQLNIATYPASANFLLLQLPAAMNPHQIWERMIVEHRIVLRSCANFEGLPEPHLRAAVRSEHDNRSLIHGLKQVLEHPIPVAPRV